MTWTPEKKAAYAAKRKAELARDRELTAEFREGFPKVVGEKGHFLLLLEAIRAEKPVNGN